jgi:hypothetical protein
VGVDFSNGRIQEEDSLTNGDHTRAFHNHLPGSQMEVLGKGLEG